MRETVAESVYTTREAWLLALVDACRPMFAAHDNPIPDKVRVSCGWPSRSGLAAKDRRVGEAWSVTCSADGTHETFLSPVLAEPAEVAHVLVHELVHHAVGVKAGHKGPFRKLAVALGLRGPMRATTPGQELAERLHAICKPLGPYPHAALTGSNGRKKQTTRMLKVACLDCGCIVRMARQAIADVGVPTCACGGAMAEA